MDKSNRYATNLQNRLLKGINALVSLDQIESSQLGIHENTVTIAALEQADSAMTLEMSGATKASPSSSKEGKK